MGSDVQSRPWPRPLFWLTVSLAAGIAFEHAFLISFSEPLLWGSLAFLTLLLLAGSRTRHSFLRTPTPFMLIFFGLGLLCCRLAAPVLPVPPLLSDFYNRPALFLAEVSSPAEFYPEKVQLTLRLHSAMKDGIFVPVEGEALLSLNGAGTAPAAWLAGDMLLARITLKRFHNFNNPGGDDYVRSQAERGLYARAYAADDRFLVKLNAPAPSFPSSALRPIRAGLDRFRQNALVWLRGNLDADTAAFYAALLLGYQRLLSPAWQEHLSRTGVTHLLSIGGMHLAFVCMAVFWLVRLLVRSFQPAVLHRTSDRMIALWPALAAAVVYAFIAGFSSPPIWRSTLMLALCLAAACSYRYADQLSVLAAAAFVILTIEPNSLQQISFQLTFACMFAIFSLYPRFQRLQLARSFPVFRRHPVAAGILRPFEEAFWVSIAVNMLVLPLTVYYFRGISLAGFVANIFLVPAVGFAVLPPGLLSIALYAINEHIAVPVLALGGWCLLCCQKAILWFSNLSWAFFWVGNLSLPRLVCIYAALLFALGPWRKKVKAAGLAAVLLLFAGMAAFHGSRASSNAGNRLEATAIDVGQGTSILVRFPMGETMLVDGGGFYDDSFDIGRAVLAPFLWRSGIDRLDYVVLTHDHPDHRNGLRFIMSHFDVGQFWESRVSSGEREPGKLKDIAVKRAIPHPGMREIQGEHAFGPCSVRVIHPSPEYRRDKWDGRDLNNVSLVVKIEYGTTRLILPGDIGASVEELLFGGDSFGGGTVIVSPHHGSERSNSASMFDRVKPVGMIFPCGYDNSFGFPAPSVLEECRRRGIASHRTDLDGAVHAVSDGQKWTITSELNRNVSARGDSRR